VTNEEKIQDKQGKIEKLKNRIKEDQKKIGQLENEIGELESLEIKGLIQELNIPFTDLKKLLKELKK
jgi:membrane protein insertase Oxa1/YidC/SpoIIIJ